MSEDSAEKPDGDEEKEPEEKPTRLGKFIQAYSGFLSSFVLGAAGLIATSTWQSKQFQIAKQQAESQQKIAQTQAENQWRIERAEILSKNLQVLASHGGATVDQRYGVLLSLTRGSILDPELAVSYALELGKDNPEYMRSVLSSTSEKDYVQLAHAFVLSCEQRYGVTKDVEVCKADRFAGRSDSIARLISDELDQSAPDKPGPLLLLKDERQVQSSPGRMAWLFAPYLTQLYERRQWDQVAHFESFSTGAHLVAALVLATARTGELVTSGEAAQLDKFHGDHRRWLLGYLFGGACDGDCKGRLLEVMLAMYAEAQGDYDEALRKLLSRPRGEVGPAVGRLHARLLWCQVAPEDLGPFRDRVLVPALAELLKGAKPDVGAVDDLADLLALAPEPTTPTESVAWKGALEHLHKWSPERWQRGYVERRVHAEAERKNPPPALRKVDFCGAAEVREESAPATE